MNCPIETANALVTFEYVEGRLIYSKAFAVRDVFLSKTDRGYLVVAFEGKRVKVHRLVWLLVHGEWPQHDLDHIDGDKTNNNIDNLRPANTAQNNMNKPPRKRCASKYKGVTRDNVNNKWRAKVTLHGKNVFTKRFTSELDAAQAYNTAALKHFGEYARLNILEEPK